MYQAVKTFTSEGPDARKWIGRIIIAVILGEAIWSLIVSVMNNLVVPWLGDVMGPASGLPTSFTQRPYDYPDLFVSIVELCIAVFIAAIVNYFFQRKRAGRAKPVMSSVPTAPVEPARFAPQAATAAAMPPPTSQVAPPAPAGKMAPITPPAPVTIPPPARAPVGAPASVARPLAVANSVAAKPQPRSSKTDPPKLEKPREVYYNIVGDPMPSDEE